MATKQVSYYLLQYQNDCVFIRKKQSLLTRKLLFFLFVVLLGGWLFWSLLTKSPDAFKKPIDFSGLVFIGLIGIVLIVHLVFGAIRFLRVISDFKLCKQQTLTINGNPLNSTISEEEILVVVQDVGAVGGIGGSFTVGVAQGKRFFGLCYELKKEHAKTIAEFIADNLRYRIEYREAVFFPLFKLH